MDDGWTQPTHRGSKRDFGVLIYPLISAAGKSSKQQQRPATKATQVDHAPKLPKIQGSLPVAPISSTSSPSVEQSSTKLSQVQQDLQGMGLDDDDEDQYVEEDVSTLPIVSVAKEKILEEIKIREKAEGFKPVVSMVVVGKQSPIYR